MIDKSMLKFNSVNKNMQIMATSNEFSSPRAFVKLTAQKAEQSQNGVNFLFDTGATTSLISEQAFQYFRRNGKIRRKLNVEPKISNASGNRMATNGVYDIAFHFEGKPCHGVFIVAPDLNGQAILGMNVISFYNMVLDPMTRKVTMYASKPLPPTGATASDEGIASVSFSTQESADWLVQVSEAAVLEPQFSTRIRCRLVHPETRKPLLEQHSFVADVDGIMAFAFTSSDNGAFYPHIPNAGTECRKMERGTIIGTAHHLDSISFINDESPVNAVVASTPPPRAHNRDEKKRIYQGIEEILSKSDIPENMKPRYRLLLQRNEDVSSADKLDLGLTDVIRHSIDINEKEKPAYKGQFRLAMDQLQLIKDNVAGWIRAGLVQRSESKFNAPVFCVPKREGQGLRVVLDYRMLNQKSVPDRYSIRTIDQCLEEIGRAGSTVFSCLDLTNGFWQLQLRESDRHFTAFTIPGLGQFEWLVTPQGLMGAPASFSRLMDKIMSDAENIITYIDDVLIHSGDHEKHLIHVEEALKRLRQAHLRLNVGKCIFGATSVQYLGHTLTAKGVKPGKDKTAAIREVEPPKTLKQLKAFLGLANYFRSFIPSFAKIAAPLFALTRKETIWKNATLPEEAINAF